MQNQTKFTIGGIATFLLIIFSVIFNPISYNESGFRTHVQQLTGKEFIRFEPGLFFAGFFAKTTEWPDVLTISFSDEELTEEVTSDNDRATIRFSDAARALCEATVRWRLPNNEADMIKIHKEYRSAKRLAETTLTLYTKECLKYSAQLMESETHYSGGMSKLSEDFQDQLIFGQYILEQKTEYKKDTVDKTYTKFTAMYVKKDTNGVPLRNISDIQQFNIDLTYASIGEVDYDSIIDIKLQAKIEQSTRESISKQSLITAQQEKLTAEEQGKKLLAEVTAKYEAEKKQAVIQAQKEKEVEKEQSEKAKWTAAKIKYNADAEAAKNQALVKAGLTPQEKAEWDYKTKVGVAAEYSKVSVPSILIVGGEGGSNPLDAIGINMLLDIEKKLNK